MWHEPWDITGDSLVDYYIQKARDYPQRPRTTAVDSDARDSAECAEQHAVPGLRISLSNAPNGEISR